MNDPGQNYIGNPHLDSHEINLLQPGLMSLEPVNSEQSSVLPYHLPRFPLGPQFSHTNLLHGKLVRHVKIAISRHRGWVAADQRALQVKGITSPSHLG